MDPSAEVATENPRSSSGPPRSAAARKGEAAHRQPLVQHELRCHRDLHPERHPCDHGEPGRIVDLACAAAQKASAASVSTDDHLRLLPIRVGLAQAHFAGCLACGAFAEIGKALFGAPGVLLSFGPEAHHPVGTQWRSASYSPGRCLPASFLQCSCPAHRTLDDLFVRPSLA